MRHDVARRSGESGAGSRTWGQIKDKLLAAPRLFEAYQALIGAPACHSRFISEMVRPAQDERVLEIGCGTGASVPFLPAGLSYVGIDISAPYIAKVQARYGDRGRFICADLASIDPSGLGTFDRAFSMGVLHHLPDGVVAQAVALVQRVVRPGGRFVTMDPCYVSGQSSIAKFLLDNDRGRHIRDQAGFERLLSGVGPIKIRIVHDMLRIPYTQIIMDVTLRSSWTS